MWSRFCFLSVEQAFAESFREGDYGYHGGAVEGFGEYAGVADVQAADLRLEVLRDGVPYPACAAGMGAFDVATALLGADNVWQFLFLLVWAPLALDVTWWLIRYFDFKRDPIKAAESYGEENAWHSREDWDNWLGLPLVAGCYWWWWVLGGLGIVLGVMQFI